MAGPGRFPGPVPRWRARRCAGRRWGPRRASSGPSSPPLPFDLLLSFALFAVASASTQLAATTLLGLWRGFLLLLVASARAVGLSTAVALRRAGAAALPSARPHLSPQGDHLWPSNCAYLARPPTLVLATRAWLRLGAQIAFSGCTPSRPHEGGSHWAPRMEAASQGCFGVRCSLPVCCRPSVGVGGVELV